MHIISNTEYELFQSLKEKADGIYNLSSAKKIKRLEDDIDEPIKRCVAMLALLQCEPKFSCCGFDYDGQPIHKSHQYGNPYITCHKNKFSEHILKLVSENNMWKIKKRGSEIILEEIITDKNGNPYWRSSSCIHFSEECVIAIACLERTLIQLKEYFSDSVSLFDTNVHNKRATKFWQYPPKESWTINKLDYI